MKISNIKGKLNLIYYINIHIINTVIFSISYIKIKKILKKYININNFFHY